MIHRTETKIHEVSFSWSLKKVVIKPLIKILKLSIIQGKECTLLKVRNCGSFTQKFVL